MPILPLHPSLPRPGANGLWNQANRYRITCVMPYSPRSSEMRSGLSAPRKAARNSLTERTRRRFTP